MKSFSLITSFDIVAVKYKQDIYLRTGFFVSNFENY